MLLIGAHTSQGLQSEFGQNVVVVAIPDRLDLGHFDNGGQFTRLIVAVSREPSKLGSQVTLRWIEHAHPPRLGNVHRFLPRVHAKFAIEASSVRFEGVLGDEEFRSDFREGVW